MIFFKSCKMLLINFIFKKKTQSDSAEIDPTLMSRLSKPKLTLGKEILPLTLSFCTVGTKAL